jgi:peptidoglycan hydrolase-like protein with peptidoglycan-binding domain
VRFCASGGASEHKDGRAWDWMLDIDNTRDRAAAADFLAWLTKDGRDGTPGANARRLGVMYVIYNRKIWSHWSADQGWRAYDGYDPHTSHIHVSLSWNGARAHTSFWTGRTWPLDYGTCQVFTGQPAVVPPRHPRTEPCPTAVEAPRTSSRPLLWMGSTGSAVSEVQRRLDVSADSVFGTTTRSAVLHYQRSHELPRTGAVDGPTWASLDPADADSNVPRWRPREALAWARDAGYPALGPRDGGKAVYALQTALGLRSQLRTGFFGRRTRAAVIAVKTDGGMPKTAQVDAEVWALLD